MRLAVALLLLPLAASTFAQDELIGPGRFPETRGLSGLPGGGFGVLRNGRPSFRGAMALSTPIAYSLDRWHWAAAISSTGTGSRFAGIDTESDENVSSGTGALMVGLPTDFGALTYSAMFVSVHLDEITTNVQLTPAQRGPVVWAVGVQDLFDTSGTYRPRERRSARSPFVVGTANPLPGAYVSVGYGNQRFGGVFGNASLTLGDWKALAEYDTYNWNYGLARRLGGFPILDREAEATLFLGVVRGKYATWSLAITF